MKLYKTNRTVRAFIKNSIELLKTTLETKLEVIITCGINQGDALFLLLFCIGLNPLSQIITKTGLGYRSRNGNTINHLFSMDDIKLDAKSEQEFDSVI